MSLVPLPWWTSQSRISTRSRPCSSSACSAATRDVVEQAEAHRAGVRRRDGRAGAPAANATSALAAQQRVDGSRRRRRRRAARPPTSPRWRPCRRRCGRRRRRTAARSRRRSRGRGSARAARGRRRGDSRRSKPRPAGPVELALDRRRSAPRDSGCGPVSWPSEAGWLRKTRAAIAVRYPRMPDGSLIRGRARRGRSGRGGPVHGAAARRRRARASR